MHHFFQHFVELWQRFIEARDRPHAMAGGMAIGVFFGFIPAFGLKTLLALGTSLAFRCNVIAAVVGVTFHDLFFWTWPFLFRFEFQLGYWLLSNPHTFAPKLVRSDFRLSELISVDHFIDIGLPLLLGSVIIAIPCSLLSYGMTLFFMHYRQRRENRGK